MIISSSSSGVHALIVQFNLSLNTFGFHSAFSNYRTENKDDCTMWNCKALYWGVEENICCSIWCFFFFFFCSSSSSTILVCQWFDLVYPCHGQVVVLFFFSFSFSMTPVVSWNLTYQVLALIFMRFLNDIVFVFSVVLFTTYSQFRANVRMHFGLIPQEF